MAAKLGGGPKKKFDLGQNSEINVTPFVDVMLVLLIIFMVAAPLATVSIAIDLPPAIPPPPGTKTPDPTIVFIQKSGAMFIAGNQTRLENLPTDIPANMVKNGVTTNFQNERVFLQAEPDVLYEDFMNVLNVLQSNGYYKVGIINEDIS